MKTFFSLIFLLFFSFSSNSFAGSDPQLMRAVSLTYNAQFAEATTILNNYINVHPDDPMGYLLRGTSLDWKQKVMNLRGALDAKILEDYENANIIAFRQWEKDPENVDKNVVVGNSYMYLAKKWLDVGKKTRAGLILKKCQKHMDFAIKKDPKRFDAYMAVGVFNFYAAHIPPGLQFLASLLGINGNESLGLSQMEAAAHNPNLLQADALFVLAYSLGDGKKNYAGAIPYLSKIISLYPDNPNFRLIKGEYLMRAKQYDVAKKDLNDFLIFCEARTSCVQSNRFLANYFLASVSLIQKKMLEMEIPVERALKLNVNQYPDKIIRLHMMKGFVLQTKGKKDEANTEFQIVEAGKSVNPGAWKELQRFRLSM